MSYGMLVGQTYFLMFDCHLAQEWGAHSARVSRADLAGTLGEAFLALLNATRPFFS